MKQVCRSLFMFLAMVLLCRCMSAQQAPVSAVDTVVVPRLVNFAGKAVDARGKTMSGIVGLTFAIYSQESGGAPLWMEVQNVQVDTKGNYSAQLGATKSEGLPLELFASGEARWLGVRINGSEEQPRVLLLSVPYALKAADAQTLGGLPASAFLLAGSANGAAVQSSARSSSSSASTAPPAGTTPVTTAGGTVNKLAKFDASADITNSQIFDNGTNVGIGNTAPASKLDISGGATVRGLLNLPPTGTATASAGKNSQPFSYSASSYNSGTGTAVNQNFRWQAEPTGNNTASASGTLNLLHSLGGNAPAETGLKITANGQITFAAGQGFPIPSSSVTNAELQHSSLTVKAGTDLTGGGSVALGGTTTLNVDTTKIPQLAAANVFTNHNTINVNTNCNGTNCNPGLSVNNAGNGNGTNSGGDGVDINTGNYSVGLRINSGSLGAYVNSNFSGAIFEGNGGGGLYGDEQVDEDFLAGINGYQIAGPATHKTIGVWGSSTSPNGFGVYGNQVLSNQSGFQRPAGVWGDSSASAGVVGTSDIDDAVVGLTADKFTNQRAGFFDNTSSEASEVVIQAEGFTVGGYCAIYTNGDLACTGSKSAVVPVAGGSRKVALYAIEGPENWFEDAGSAQLANGVATVTLESTFGETVNTNMDYRIFLTPDGDCKGLYVAQKTAASFVVRELGGGTSNVAFDYRIMAQRKGYESIRLADKTAVFHLSETPSGMKKQAGYQIKPPPSPQQIREQRLKMAGIRSITQLRAVPGPASKK
jgi:hypothetical protein